MAVEVKMPKLGMTMTQGKIVRWIKAVGEAVEVEEPIYAVANDKVTIDVESPAAGTIIRISAEEGETVPVGDIVAYIGDADEALDTNDEKATIEAPVEKNEEKIVKNTGDLRATPAARALAKKLGIEIMAVKNYYGKSRIKRADVENYNEVPQAAVTTASAEPEFVDITPSNIRAIAAARMTDNFMNVPHFYLGMKVDVTNMQSMLENARKKVKGEDAKPTFTDVMVWIISRVIKEYPIINSQWNDGKIRQFRDVNFGIATDTPDGLLVPVIKKSDTKSFKDVVADRSDVIGRARDGNLLPDDMLSGTFTLSNLGMFGIDVFQAIINAPECALLSVGTVENELSIENDVIKSTPVMKMSLSCDHRVLDGATGAKFLKRLKDVMENPAKLLDRDLF